MKALPPAMSKQGVGLSKFIANPSAITKAMDLPASKQTVDVSATDVTSKPTIKPKVEPQQNLVPDPVAAMGVDPKTGDYLSKEDRIKQFKERRAKRAMGIDPDLPEAGEITKVDKLEDAGVGEDQVKEKVKKDLEDEFEIDPKMKKAFMDALALPAKSAAVAMTDLLEKIPAPSKEASKILNRNISKISQSFKLGAASAEVANDEADNDNKEEKGGSVIGGLLAKAINFVKGKVGGGGGEEGAPEQSSAIVPSPGGALVGDPTEGRRAPYTGTADGIGLGDGTTGSRAMQPIKKRKSLARKLFNLTPMGMAFNAGTKIFQGAKGLAGKASGLGKGLKGLAGKAFSMTPMGIGLKLGMKAFGGIKNMFSPKNEQTVNLTELTDKVIQENRESADSKTEKQVALAAGVTAGENTPPPAPSPQEGSELAQPEIFDSPYLDVYNTTSQF